MSPTLPKGPTQNIRMGAWSHLQYVLCQQSGQLLNSRYVKVVDSIQNHNTENGNKASRLFINLEFQKLRGSHTLRSKTCHMKISPTQKWSPAPILVAKNDSPNHVWLPKMVPPTTFVCQKWSHLAKTGPGRTKLGNQNRSGGPLLAARSGPLDQFGLLRMSVSKP